MEIAFRLAMTVFACLGFGWLAFLIGKHGWGWVRTKLKARAMDARARLLQDVSGVVGPLDERIEQRIHAAIQSELAKFESDLAAIKAKVGGLS